MRKKIQVESSEIYCDVCEKKWTDFFKYNCSQCGRDLCGKCAKWHPYQDGDYPEKFCPECWKICEPFIQKIREKEQEHDEEIDNIEQEMREAIKEITK